jgi:hypothetical protein
LEKKRGNEKKKFSERLELFDHGSRFSMRSLSLWGHFVHQTLHYKMFQDNPFPSSLLLGMLPFVASTCLTRAVLHYLVVLQQLEFQLGNV